MIEDEFGAKMKPWLDRSAAAVGEVQATRLRAARLRAMDAYREPAGRWGLAASSSVLRFSFGRRALLAIPAVALLVAVGIQMQATSEPDLAEIDAQLLTQELPPDAFLDPDFRAWLKSQG